MNSQVGTGLFDRTISFDYGDDEVKALVGKVWRVTPWMVNVKTGSPDSGQFAEIRLWCDIRIGPEARPIHGRDGRWQTGSATVFGETFMGFATKDLMDEFIAAFPDLIVQEQIAA